MKRIFIGTHGVNRGSSDARWLRRHPGKTIDDRRGQSAMLFSFSRYLLKY